MLTEHGCCLCLCLLYGGFEDEVQLAIVEVTGRLAFELAVVAEDSSSAPATVPVAIGSKLDETSESVEGRRKT